jgi:hypothetical protein
MAGARTQSISVVRPSAPAAPAPAPAPPRRKDPEGSRVTSFGGPAKPRSNQNPH